MQSFQKIINKLIDVSRRGDYDTTVRRSTRFVFGETGDYGIECRPVEAVGSSCRCRAFAAAIPVLYPNGSTERVRLCAGWRSRLLAQAWRCATRRGGAARMQARFRWESGLFVAQTEERTAPWETHTATLRHSRQCSARSGAQPRRAGATRQPASQDRSARHGRLPAPPGACCGPRRAP